MTQSLNTNRFSRIKGHDATETPSPLVELLARAVAGGMSMWKCVEDRRSLAMSYANDANYLHQITKEASMFFDAVCRCHVSTEGEVTAAVSELVEAAIAKRRAAVDFRGVTLPSLDGAVVAQMPAQLKESLEALVTQAAYDFALNFANALSSGMNAKVFGHISHHGQGIVDFEYYGNHIIRSVHGQSVEISDTARHTVTTTSEVGQVVSQDIANQGTLIDSAVLSIVEAVRTHSIPPQFRHAMASIPRLLLPFARFVTGDAIRERRIAFDAYTAAFKDPLQHDIVFKPDPLVVIDNCILFGWSDGERLAPRTPTLLERLLGVRT